jgi:hypothetical protein
LKLTLDERGLLLDLLTLDEELRGRIEATPISEANVQFTLKELARLAKAIPTKASHPWERKAKRNSLEFLTGLKGCWGCLRKNDHTPLLRLSCLPHRHQA